MGKINANLSDAAGDINKIKGDISSLCQGGPSTQFNNSFDKINAEINTFEELMSSFNTALDKLEEYKKKDEKIEEYNNKITGEKNNPSKKETFSYKDSHGVQQTGTRYVVDNDKIRGWESEIAKLNQEKEELKAEIQALLDGIEEITAAAVLSGSIDPSQFSPKFLELYKQFMDNIYNNLPYGQNKHGDLSNRLENAGINLESMTTMINDVKSLGLSNREQTLLIYFGFMKMCYEKNTYIYYNNSTGAGGYGPTIPITKFLKGTDCVGAIDFMINAGCTDINGNGVVEWRTCSAWGINTEHYYRKEDYSKIRPGDLYVSSGHICMVVDVDVEKNVYYTLEDGNFRYARRLSDLNSEHYIANADNIYNGTNSQNPYIKPESRSTQHFQSGYDWMR